ncbi:MAG: hypothetical protein KF716_27575 [Anaerolineae bacterium]|nr:hypothetical protein [Anaerolineae bacterium]
MEWLLTLHSLVRYLVILVSLISLVWFALVMAKRITGGESRDRMLMAIFSGLIDLQVLIGLVYLVATSGDVGWPGFRIEHAVTMIIAAVVAHLPMRWRKSDLPREVKARNNLLVIVVVIVIVLLGIARLPGNRWQIG